MGTATSNQNSHEPLGTKRNPSAPAFKRHASCRGTKGEKRGSPRRMDRLRRSFRDSFRRRKDHVPESSKPHQWQADEAAVRAGTCTFFVKYMGCVEVYESRGMQVCEEALKVLRNSRRRPVKATLYVSGDGLRVVEEETKGLIVDQTIEKVSFCAPDRNTEKGFSYICRDGTTRRWMCHGFLALKESGERLSHAVGCAFAACLERKQRRDKECGVTMSFDPASSTFTRTGSFRQQSLTERLHETTEAAKNRANTTESIMAAAPAPTDPSAQPVSSNQPFGNKQPISNPHAIERPHATPTMLQRQGSFRGFNPLNQASPFKRQLSLRVSDLPSNLERTRSLSLDAGPNARVNPLIQLKTPVSPIPEVSPGSDKADPVSVMCQQLSQGLQMLTDNDDFLPSDSQLIMSRSNVSKQLFPTDQHSTSIQESTTVNSESFLARLDSLQFHNNTTPTLTPPATPPLLPRPDQWLGKVAAVTLVGGGRQSPPTVTPRRPPPLSHLRAHSLGSVESHYAHRTRSSGSANANGTHDPFDAEWVSVGGEGERPPSTNPFLSSNTAVVAPMKAFEVHM